MALRITTGKWRNRSLIIPPATITRPASNRVREAIINILKHTPRVCFETLEGLFVLDAYAGSGAVGFEMLSNGASHVTFCENHPEVVTILQQNTKNLRVENSTTILAVACQMLCVTQTPMDVVFIDPPYHQDQLTSALTHLVAHGWIGTHTRVVIEHTHDEEITWTDGMHTVFKRSYGKPVIHIGRYLG
ncbi:MAG: 16S rRNA (guanine(966)-N(2))-methyltransferase RsmD [Alphaproteobacteria bacterium]|nr:MAG: 16S rRNA (guanine(966)-N(2))-methyltransferase RsmD [Alphaproteobacteria bacterium]